MTQEPCVLAIDPGHAKCGVALVGRHGEVLHRSIEPTAGVASVVRHLVTVHSPVAILVGNGTFGRSVMQSVRDIVPKVPIEEVDEAHTSEEARARLLAVQRPRLWQRLLPRGLWAPAADYDDLVALILGERWWAAREGGG